MIEYTLNQLTGKQLTELALNSAAFLAEVTRLSFKFGLYYFEGHFIEVSYRKKRLANKVVQWRICTVNHFPDTPENTHYLTIYLTQIKLPVGERKN